MTPLLTHLISHLKQLARRRRLNYKASTNKSYIHLYSHLNWLNHFVWVYLSTGILDIIGSFSVKILVIFSMRSRASCKKFGKNSELKIFFLVKCFVFETPTLLSKAKVLLATIFQITFTTDTLKSSALKNFKYIKCRPNSFG